MYPCRGVSHTPHKTPRQGRVHDDGKGEIFSGRRIQHRRRGRCPLAPTSFSCLDARKGCEKKIKASPRPGNLAGYRILSLFVFCFLMSPVGAYRIRPTKRPARGDLIYLWVGVFIPAGYIWGVFFCAPTLPAEKTPGTQLDLSIRTRYLSLLDLSHFWRDLSFSCLDARKGCEKKIKASPRPGNLAGYRILSLFVFCFLLSRVGAQKHTPSKRTDRGDLIYLWVGVFIPAGYIWGVCDTPLPYRQKKRRVRSWISPRVPGICHC